MCGAAGEGGDAGDWENVVFGGADEDASDW